MKKFSLIIPFISLGIVSICSSCSGELSSGRVSSVPPPTLSELFESRSTRTSRSISTPRSEATPQPAVLPTTHTDPFVDVFVYDDGLNANWQIYQPSGMEYDLQATIQVYSGQYALEALPKGEFSSLLFAVRPEAKESYLRDQVLAVSFQLYSGEDYIETDDLLVTVLGSNSTPYYSQSDNSVVNRYDPVFSETRLYYLGINRDIPPDTWVEVTVWLDDLLYDPVYSYVTGFYIENDADFRRSFRVDDVRLFTETVPQSTK